MNSSASWRAARASSTSRSRLATFAGFLTALVVALLFGSTFVPINLAAYVAVLFVGSMISLVGAFLCFLIEIRIAVAVLRIGGQ